MLRGPPGIWLPPRLPQAPPARLPAPGLKGKWWEGEGEIELTDSVNRAGLGLRQGLGVLALAGCEAHPRLCRPPRPARLPRRCPTHRQLQPGCVLSLGKLANSHLGNVSRTVGRGFFLRTVTDSSFTKRQIEARRQPLVPPCPG